MAQIPLALGAIALVGPETVAVKVRVFPRDAVAVSSVTTTVGLALATVVV
jgi:hypothetical protein